MTDDELKLTFKEISAATEKILRDAFRAREKRREDAEAAGKTAPAPVERSRDGAPGVKR